MSKKTLRCYKCDIKMESMKTNKDSFEKVLTRILDHNHNKEVICLTNGNCYMCYESEKGDKFSLELLKKINGKDVDKKYIFFRVGKQKDMQDILKRDKTTLLGEGVLDEKQQKIYELEVCTYILLDLEKQILIEMYGQYAPTITMLSTILNQNIEKVDNLKGRQINFTYENIMTKKMIESFKKSGHKLSKIGYTYSIPNAEMLREMNLDLKQIKELKKVGSLDVQIIIRNKPRIPITKSNEIIKCIVDSFKECGKEIRDTVFFEGNIGNSGSGQKFTFNEEEVTYNIDISYNKVENNQRIALSLNEIESQVYEKIISKYEENSSDISKYILN